jgi:hypothetical protein
MRGTTVSEEIEKLLGGPRRAYDTLFEQRILFLKGPLEDENGDQLVAQLLALDAESDDEITLYINSPGGIITGMFALYDTIQLLKSPVSTRCVGLAASDVDVLRWTMWLPALVALFLSIRACLEIGHRGWRVRRPIAGAPGVPST